MTTKRVDTAREAEHEYICGSTGSGKSSHVKRAIAKARRVVVFDPDDEYGELDGFERVESAVQLLDRLHRNPKGPLKIAFVGNGRKAFDLWSRAAFAWCNCVAVAEEIADVTTPAKAPDGWGTLLRRGRKRGIKVICVTQRPAEADKTAISQAAVIHTGYLGRDADIAYVAREMKVEPAALDSLVPLDWVRYRRADLSIVGGNLTHKRVTVLREGVKRTPT